MNQLVKSDNAIALQRDILPKLPERHREIVAAGLMPKIADQPAGMVVNDLVTIIVGITTIAGQKLDTATIGIYADEFYKKLMSTYPRISIAEVKAALYAGVYDEYGDYYGLNCKTFVSFVKSYLFSESRKEAFRVLGKEAALSNERTLTPEEKERDLKDFINYSYGSYCVAQQYNPNLIPVHFYHYLESKQMIRITTEHKQKLHKEAIKIYGDLVEKSNLFTQALEKAIEKAKDKTETVKNIARRLAVAEFFADQKKAGKKLIF
ncbi:hypothetical protein [Arachidicoccus terrestris]|uniref:hypothetical protein n=1 Tax=Arachidicoccus terrestris TaxID=2875539 RepID=UPI001CC76D61|nr:hypothetical protein [Arachidicoccus terrestris]UAY56241.1 hypothetical protein K9M52_04275 [Arachidicoccus terrestris]